MGPYRKKISRFFARLAYCLGRKRRPVTTPPSTSIRPLAPQISLIFELPDELILFILSYLSPEPRLNGHYARFRIQHSQGIPISDHHQQRAKFIRPLSMTCRAMRFHFLPWIWERIESPYSWSSGEILSRKLDTLVSALHVDAFLASTVRFMSVRLAQNMPTFPLFIKCLESLPNLRTLEIGWADDIITTPLKDALKRVKLSQIKTLILPPAAYPLLRHCRDVEDIVYVVRDRATPSNEFLESLVSNRNSKVKRLAIPLVPWPNPSRFVAACPKLTELTVIASYPYGAQLTETGTPLDSVGKARSAILELIVACKTLPDFDTLQIVRIPTVSPRLVGWCGWVGCNSHRHSMEQWERTSKKHTKDLEGLAVECLKKPKTGYLEGEKGKRTTLRIIGFSPGLPCQSSVEVEEYEV